MLVIEQAIDVPRCTDACGMLNYLRRTVPRQLSLGLVPVRFVVTSSDDSTYHCEVGVVAGLEGNQFAPSSIFDFYVRNVENTDQFNVVLIVPTGIGAEIGGHAGDAGPVARMLAEASDTLILHPNVVNASDLNELPLNALYVEGAS